MAQVLDQQQTTNNITLDPYSYGGGNRDICQSFIAGLSGTLTQVSILAYGQPGNYAVKVDLYADNGSNGLGALIASDNAGVAPGLSTWTWCNLTFDTPPTLVAGTKYWLHFWSYGNSSYYSSFGASSTSTYANGALGWIDFMSTWQTDANKDLCFKTYVTAISPTKSYTLDAIVKVISTVTNTQDVIVANRNTKTNTINAIVKVTSTPSHTIDAIVKRVNTAPHLLDGIVRSSTGKTHTIDGLVKYSASIFLDALVTDDISNYQLPKRPATISLGFDGELLQVFSGVTRLPQISVKNAQSSINFYDGMQAISDFTLPQGAVQLGVRTDVYIQGILTEMGFTSADWDLDVGLQTIPICWWNGNKAGYEIQKTVEAEGGRFYQNNAGIFVFENRQHYNSDASYQTSQWAFNYNNLTDIDYPNDESSMINHVTVNVNPRVKQTLQIVWGGTMNTLLAHGSTTEIWANLNDPCTAIATLIATTDYTANTASDGSGTDETSNLSFVVTTWAESVLIEVTNNAGVDVYLTKLQLRAQPYMVKGQTIVDVSDSGSVDLYGDKTLQIDNDYLQDSVYATNLSNDIIAKYKDPAHRMVLSSMAVPQMELGDLVSVYNSFYKAYYLMRVVKISLSFDETSGMTQQTTVREVLDSELAVLFTIGTSTIEGPDIISE